MRSYTKVQDAALLILRLVIAAIFLFAGHAKWAFWSTAPAAIPAGMLILLKFLSIAEPLGALALVAGFLTRWAGAGLAIIMVGAIFILHFTMGVSFFTMPQTPGLDYNFLILGGCIALAAFGAGRWSADVMRA